MKLSSESTFFTKLMNEVYQPHLKDYVRYVQRERSLFCQLFIVLFLFFSLEKINLQNKYKLYLDRFYEKLGHTKRNFQSFK
jgi:fumarate reductase subunit C